MLRISIFGISTEGESKVLLVISHDENNDESFTELRRTLYGSRSSRIAVTKFLVQAYKRLTGVLCVTTRVVEFQGSDFSSIRTTLRTP